MYILNIILKMFYVIDCTQTNDICPTVVYISTRLNVLTV